MQYAAENWESSRVRDCNLDRRFCLGQHCVHDPVAQERQADSLYFEQSRDQFSDSNCLAARDLSPGKELSESVFRENSGRLETWASVFSGESDTGLGDSRIAAEGGLRLFCFSDSLVRILAAFDRSLVNGPFHAHKFEMR